MKDLNNEENKGIFYVPESLIATREVFRIDKVKSINELFLSGRDTVVNLMVGFQ